MPTITKKVPRFRVRVFDPADNYKFLRHMISCDDRIAALIHRDRTESTGLSQGGTLGPTESISQWTQQPEFLQIDSSLEFIAFGHAVGIGTRGTLANPSNGLARNDGIMDGLYLVPVASPQHSVINAGSGDPTEDGGTYPILNWKQVAPAVSANKGRFETILPDGKTNTRIYFNAQTPNVSTVARTTRSLKKNQQFEAEITCIAVAAGHSTRAGIRLSWSSEKLSIVLRDGAVPTLERKVGGKDVAWAKLDGEAVRLTPGKVYVVRVENIGGRLLITINGKRQDVIDVAQSAHGSDGGQPPSAPSGNNRPQPSEEPRITQWAAGTMQLRCFGVQASLGLELLDCLQNVTNDQGETSLQPLEAIAKRRIYRSLPPGLIGETTKGCRGFKKLGTSVKIDILVDEHGLEWTATLKASADGLSPLLSAVVANWISTPDSGGPTAFDITRAWIEASETTASPEVQVGGATWTMEIDRLNLETMAAAQGIDWTQKLRMDSRITFEVSWKLSSGAYTDWVTRLDGYVADDVGTSHRYGERALSLTCRDQTYRVMGNNAVIDGRYPPLDVLLFKNPGAPLYGWQMVQFLLKIGIGDAVANSLKVYQAASHWPLIGNSTAGDVAGYVSVGLHPPMQGAPLYPALFDRSIHEQIMQIASEDMFVFFWSHDPTTATTATAAPVPVYGDIREILKACPVWDLPDAVYNPGDVDFIMSAVEVRRRSDSKFNEVIVYGPSDSRQKIWPALPEFTGYARLSASDSNSVENTGWRKTMIVREGDKFRFPGVPQAVATQIMTGLEGGHIEWPTISCSRGNERIWWGHVITPKMEKNGGGDLSDTDLGLANLPCRVLRCANKYSATQTGKPASFTSVLSVFPLSAAERAAKGI